MGVVSRGRAAPEALPTGEDKARRVRAMFDGIAGRYDVLNRMLTFGLDIGWRRQAVRSLALAGGSLVFDVACGTGDLCRELAAAGYRPVGFDFSFGMLVASRTRTPMVQADALALPVGDGVADGVTCGFALRNVVDLEGLFAELARVLRSGGRVALLDVATPSNPVLRAGHSLYFNRVVPTVGGLVSDRAAYQYLPRSVAYLPPPTDMLAMLRRAGFDDVRRVALTGGIAQLVTGTRA